MVARVNLISELPVDLPTDALLSQGTFLINLEGEQTFLTRGNGSRDRLLSRQGALSARTVPTPLQRFQLLAPGARAAAATRQRTLTLCARGAGLRFSRLTDWFFFCLTLPVDLPPQEYREATERGDGPEMTYFCLY